MAAGICSRVFIVKREWWFAVNRATILSGVFNMAGFIDRDDNLAIPMRLDSARDFSEGLAAVLVDGLWGYINHAGCMVIAPQFEVAGDLLH